MSERHAPETLHAAFAPRGHERVLPTWRPPLATGFVPRGRGRAMRVIGPAMNLFWLVFLLSPLQASLVSHGSYRWLSAAAVVAQAALFATVSWVNGLARRTPGLVWSLVLGQAFCVALATLAAREAALTGLVFVTVTAVLLLPLRAALVVDSLAVAAVHVVPRLVPGWRTVDDLTLSLVLTAVVVFEFRQLIVSNRALLAAQEEVAALAVDRERERIARDMHDVLGHSLTVVAVKAELATRLVDTDPARARVETAEVQELARAALSDVRSMVSATTREPSLAAELAGARQALDAAGIAADLPTATDEVPERLRPLFAWVVREGTTNVLRHAQAHRVQITLAADRVLVEDDGPGPTSADLAAGHGLAGLTERAQAVGATVTAGIVPTGGFRLEVRA